ncbi:restriction endonuclease subunit S [Agrobacterium larrymoorei]|uniref:Restriction endonuclease subunit S n=1 Tax=Agrobacterium larrymoorei TaxID=160699 RepID=A0AAF0HEL2_9HYPH|nr:restriction endonuclease subunit S [Agrobacterium larrymoorei]WHA42966.1 restriction endonuclease subunit S [Agrobacterium larrymoorei]
MSGSAFLGELVDFYSGVGFPTEFQGIAEGELPFAKVSDISNALQDGERTISTASNYIDNDVARRLRAKPFPKGTIVFAKIGEAIRKNRRAVSSREMLFDNNVMGIYPKAKTVDANYLIRFLDTVDFYKLANSTTVPSLRKSVLSELRIPLPPLDEQKRIAAILDKADALRAKRRQTIALLDSLTQSIFLEMFGDLTTGTRKWPILALREIAEIGSGITKGRKLNSKEAIEVPYLAVANVQDKALNLTTVKTIEATWSEIERYKLEINDLLLTEGGDPDKLGRGTLWRGELPLAIHQNHIFKVRFVSSRIEPLYANWLIGSAYGKNFFLKSAKQTTGIASINKSQLSDFPMIVPPLALQRSFVERAETISTKMGAHLAHMESLNRAFAAIQTLAFRGEI